MKRTYAKLTHVQREAVAGMIFISPWIIGFMFFFAKPLFASLIYTFQKLELTPHGAKATFIGLLNYQNAFVGDAVFVRNVTTVIGNMLYEVPIIIFFSIYIAILLNGNFTGRFLVRAIFFLPVILSSGVIINVLKEDIFGGGLGNGKSAEIFQSVGIAEMMLKAEIAPKFVEFYQKVVDQVFAISWKCGVQILLFLAALQTIPASLYEASQMEGATKWESFWKITFPILSPIILLNIVYSIIDSFTDFGNIVMKKIYSTAFVEMRYAYSSTQAWIYFLLIVLILAAVFITIGRKVYYSEQ